MSSSTRTSPRIGIIFSGQGSQAAGMGAPWVDRSSWSELDVFGTNRSRVESLLLRSDAETLKRTDNAQLATIAIQLIALRDLRECTSVFEHIVVASGHSLGEYSALVAAGVLTSRGAARLILTRGEAMKRATMQAPGTMVVLVGATVEVAQSLAEDLKDIWVAAVNAPGQVVMSGSSSGILELAQLVAGLGLKLITLQVGGAFHSPLMDSASEPLIRELSATRWHPHSFPVVANFDGRSHADKDDWSALLAHQLVSTVRWEECVRRMIVDHGCEFLVEIGPGQPLGGMVRRIDKAVGYYGVSSPNHIPRLVEILDAGTPSEGRR